MYINKIYIIYQIRHPYLISLGGSLIVMKMKTVNSSVEDRRDNDVPQQTGSSSSRHLGAKSTVETNL